MAKKIKMADAAKQAILLKQPKKFFAIQQSIEFSKVDSTHNAYWLFIIRDLIEATVLKK